MRSKTIKLAKYKNNTIIHVDEASNGLGCECVCLICDERLQAVHPRFKQTHFRHNQNLECTGGPETALHLYAKQIILDSHSIRLPGRSLNYINPLPEICLGTITPDVQVEAEGFVVYFEIAVTHKCGQNKRDYYRSSKLKSVEIDLTGISYDFKKSDIRELVLEAEHNKETIFWEKIAFEKSAEESGYKPAFLLLGIAAAIYASTKIYVYVKKKFKL
jgi:hypothetical protein